MNKLLEIVYEDDELIAINKPHGLLVHRSSIARDVREFALQRLRNQINQKVYTVHRLDRKTSGVLLFAKNQATQKLIQAQFRETKVSKIYKAIVRGHITENVSIDYPLTNEQGKTQEAHSNIKPIELFEIPLKDKRFSTSRYTLVEVIPSTGRYHQIRKHLAHIRHPILGDRPHGCNKQNKLWKERFAMDHMMLHAQHLSFLKPDGSVINVIAKVSESITRMMTILRVMDRY